MNPCACGAFDCPRCYPYFEPDYDHDPDSPDISPVYEPDNDTFPDPDHESPFDHLL